MDCYNILKSYRPLKKDVVIYNDIFFLLYKNKFYNYFYSSLSTGVGEEILYL